MNLEAIKVPTNSQLKVAGEMTKCGIFTINEVRAVIGLPPLPYGHGLAVIGRVPE
ncbi:hypothetical protein GOD90_10415 [Sinorhizobium medicae]|uniref:hypothetical protein n=1 Tax=Rhizobium meliloti TaxID=382 RepID=UPI0003F673F3|nr:hypothetical protein [Sinorhizobium meliloti]MDX0897406.1 hypothetical protein [Sinorhizobium medicae]